MDGIKDLLLNILFLLVPIFAYQSFWGDKAHSVTPNSRIRVVIAILCSVALILCMTFPVYSIPGYRLDLRLIPVFISILYGGYRPGLATVLVMFAYRFYIGGNSPGFTYMIWAFPLSIAMAFLFVARFPRFSRSGKMLTLSLLTLPQLFATCWFSVMSMNVPWWKNPYLPFFGILTLVYMFSIWVCVSLIENMREKIVLRAEIQRAEKLQVLGDLAASIAHEIRNPMTVVRGFLQLLQENQIPDEKRHRYLQMGIEELDRSETIITNYLSFARPQVEKLVTVNVTERIDHVVGIISSFATLHNVEIQKALQHDLHVEGDPEKLSQVLINLIKNSIEAMPSGGTITIESVQQKQHVTIHIIDTGIGMTTEEVSRIGNPYFSTKEAGTGLGLMVSFQIIHSMNGKVHVQSERGRGTAFIISLPASLSAE